MFCALAEESLTPLRELGDYLREPDTLPQGESGRWFVLDCMRQHVREGRLETVEPAVIDRFMRALPDEHQLQVLTDLVDRWAELGAEDAMFELLGRVAQV
jgi:hypothetical protein